MGTILDGALIVMLSCFMPFHVRMVLLNETTIEGPSPEFHAGLLRNWKQVMGKDRRFWMLPWWGDGPDGDGIHWPSPLVTWGDGADGADDGAGAADDAYDEEASGGRRVNVEVCAGTSHLGSAGGCSAARGGGARGREQGRLLRDCGNCSSSDGD